jgi:hypothetical protein
MKYSILISIFFLFGCYKDPLTNSEDFMIGRWQLVEIGGVMWPPSANIPVYFEPPFEFYFIAEKSGIWIEYADGKKINRRRFFSNSFRYSDSTHTTGKFSCQFAEYNVLFPQIHTGELYFFEVNSTQDTLKSNTYPPYDVFSGFEDSFYSAALTTYTFVKTK